jgi:hypothetical protein
MDPSEVYPDLIGQAVSHSAQRLAQMGSLVASWAVVEARRKERRNAAKAARNQEEVERLREQERAACKLARAGWAPALDRKWLAQADLLQIARTWSAAAAYADADPEASSAASRCEERLSTLRPYAMARYERLRAEGAGRFDAMREAIPLFARSPHARPGDPAPDRKSLTARSSRPQATAQPAEAGTGVRRPGPEPEPEPASPEDQRGQQIVARLQARAIEERGSELSPDELATVLGATTTLSADVIARLARGETQERIAAAAERDRAFDLDRTSTTPVTRDGERAGHLEHADQDKLAADTASAHATADKNAAHLAAESFPCTVTDAVRTASIAASQNGPTRALPVRNVRWLGRSM